MRTLHCFIRSVLSTALLAQICLGWASPVMAGDGTVGYDPLHPQNVALANGRVYWDVGACKGTCSAQDVDPNMLGLPVRPWQRGSGTSLKGFQLSLIRGLRIAYVNPQGQAATYIGGGQTICFNYTAAEAQQAGGLKNLDIAYYDSTIENCDNGWNGKAGCQRKVYGNWYPLNTFRNTAKYPNPIVTSGQTKEGGLELCTGMRLAANYALVSVGPVPVTPSSAAMAATPTPAVPPTVVPGVVPGVVPAAIANISRSLRGDYFYIENRTVSVGDEIWFDFQVTNNSPYNESYGVLSIHSDYGINGLSWTNSTFKAFSVLQWRDHIQVKTPGIYPFYLAVCYASVEECRDNKAPWERMSATITVAVDTPLPPTGYTSRGVRSDYFYVENLTPQRNQPIWFDFQVTNTTDGDVTYAVLSAQVSQVKNGASWTNATLKAHQVLKWRDHIDNLPPGNYGFSFGICYADKEDCLRNLAPWERLSDDVVVTVQP